MSTINIFRPQEFDCKAVDFKINGVDYSFKSQKLLNYYGLYFNYIKPFDSFKDFKINNDSFLFLLDLQNNNDVFLDKNVPLNTNDYKKINSSVCDFNGNLIKLYPDHHMYAYGGNDFKLNDTLSFEFSGNLVSIKNNNNLFLTYNNNDVFFDQEIIPLDSTNIQNQYFEYFLGDESIILFVYNTNFKKILGIDDNKKLSVLNYNYDKFSKSYFVFNSYKKNQKKYDDIKDSFLVKYQSNPILNQKELIIQNKDKSFKQNYLGIFPIKGYNVDAGNNAIFSLDVMPLKNYQTSEYEYNNNPINRVYNKIFTGTNENNGYNHIYLSYETDTITIEFQPNTYTKFYYSPTSNQVSINSSNLDNSGAIGGGHPLVSDRIYVNTKNKLQENKNLDISDPNFSYLCSWFNGIQWVDRYYNSAYYTLDQALSADIRYYNSLYIDNKFVYDIPSSVTMIPGTEYLYYRVSKNDYKKYLNYFEYRYDNNIVYNTKILSISNWTSGVLIDDSIYQNNGIAYFNDPTTFNKNYWIMDGQNYAVFPANEKLVKSKNLTVSIWLNVKDWANITGSQIFGNYYNSGFGLINDSKIISPFISFINNNTDIIYTYNYRFGLIRKKTLVDGMPKTYKHLQRMPDYTYWVFDENLRAFHFSPDDNLIEVLTLDVQNIDQVEIDKNQNMYIFDKTNSVYDYLDTTNHVISQGQVDSSTNRIEVDLNNNLITIIGNASVIDNDNVLWESIGTNLYYCPDPNNRDNKIIFGIFGNINQITCDAYNNIWVLFNDTSFSKINSKREIEITKQFSKSVIPVKPNCPPAQPIIIPSFNDLIEELPFLSTTDYEYVLDTRYEDILVDYPEVYYITPVPVNYKRKRVVNFITSPVQSVSPNCYDIGNGNTEDQMIIIDETDNQAYIFNQLGEPVVDIDFNDYISGNDVFNVNTDGDFTGYQFLRKFIKNTGQLTWNLKINQYDGNDITNISSSSIVKLPFNVTNLSKGWHNFTLVFDSDNQIINAYIDANQVASEILNGYYVIGYDYGSSLLLGAASIQYNILNNIADVYNGYNFIGNVSDLKIYDIALNNGDINTLYLSSDFTSENTSMKWNMQIGKRNYIEQVKHIFKFQLPSNKSKYFNINIHNLNIDKSLKQNIENAIGNILSKITPAYTKLYNINWK